MDDRKPPMDEEDDGSRRAATIGLLVAAVIIVGSGIWLVNARVDANKRERCLDPAGAIAIRSACRNAPTERAGSADHQIRQKFLNQLGAGQRLLNVIFDGLKLVAADRAAPNVNGPPLVDGFRPFRSDQFYPAPGAFR